MGDRDEALEALERIETMLVDFGAMVDFPDDRIHDVRIIRQALKKQRVPTGWKPVPMVPTDRMMREGMGADSTAINAPTALNCYYAMLAAAPEANDG